MYSHMNALQRDVCPSATRFEGEIIAMGLDLMHASEVDRQRAGRHAHQRRQRQHPARHARLPRAGDARTGSRAPTSSSRRPPIPRSTRRAICSGSRCGGRRSTRTTAQVDVDAMASMIDGNTAAIIGSACNYGYGTIDPIAELSDAGARARRRPARRRLPRRVHPPVRRAARVRHPAVRLPSSRRHDDLGRHAQVRLQREGHVDPDVPRQGAAQRPVLLHDRLVGRQVRVARHRRLAIERSAGRDVGVARVARPRGLPASTPSGSSTPRTRCRTSVRAHPELRIIGNPSFCFSFTSDVFDIYHVNDAMKARGLAAQRPAVPERDPHGGDEAADAARRAGGVAARPAGGGRLRQRAPRRAGPELRRSTAGQSVPTEEITAKINAAATDLLDTYQSLPPHDVRSPDAASGIEGVR